MTDSKTPPRARHGLAAAVAGKPRGRRRRAEQRLARPRIQLQQSEAHARREAISEESHRRHVRAGGGREAARRSKSHEADEGPSEPSPWSRLLGVAQALVERPLARSSIGQQDVLDGMGVAARPPRP